VFGSSAADTAVFGTAGARLNGDSDVDLTFSGLDQVELDGNDGADTLSTGGGGASGQPIARPSDIDGGNGSDALTGGRGFDTINGAADDSTASAPGDEIRGGEGGDTLSGGPGNDEVLGNDGGDAVDGNLGDDVINGGPDGDTLGYYGGIATLDGADDISGGADFDTLYMTARTQNVLIKLDDLANDGGDVAGDGTAEEGDNVNHDVEGVQTGIGNDRIDARFRSARLLQHQFEGNSGNDSLYGGDADDTLYGQPGNDTLEGGDEDDTLDGAAGLDALKAGDGFDSLYPGADNDTVDAGEGGDYLDGGGATPSGTDSWIGGPGFDRLYLGGRTADLIIDLDNQADDGEAGENDNIRTDIERFDLGAGNDTLNAATAAANAVGADNEIYGNNGNDTIKSGPGEDYADGAIGNDEFTGGPGEDRALGAAGADKFLMKDGFFDHVDGGSGDGVNDTGQFDTFDERLNFP
jgi:Ca2+-binding RTX toxin-like protein